MNGLEIKGIKPNVRMTRKRKIVLDILMKAECHLTAEKIYQRTRKVEPSIGRTTVYRTMKLFESNDMIDRHTFRTGRSYYESKNGVPHDHLVDVHSGQVVEFCDEDLERLKVKVAEKLGYRLLECRLELYAKPIVDSEP